MNTADGEANLKVIAKTYCYGKNTWIFWVKL